MAMKNLGVALVILGGIAVLFGVIGYSRHTTILAVGGMRATTTEHKTIPFAPIVGAIALISGFTLALVPRMRRT
jgi:hypothetical protein